MAMSIWAAAAAAARQLLCCGYAHAIAGVQAQAPCPVQSAFCSCSSSCQHVPPMWVNTTTPTPPPPPLLPLCCIACSLKGRVTLASPAPGTPTPPPSLTALGLAPSAAVAIDGVAAAVPEGGWGAGAAGGCVEVAWDGRQQQVLVKVRG